MNLAGGKLLEFEERQNILDHLESRVLQTLSHSQLAPLAVAEACGELAGTFDWQEYSQLLVGFGADRRLAERYLAQAKKALSKECLLGRLKNELGAFYGQTREFTSTDRAGTVRERILPLGVLLHIAAGNADGLPVFSVIEGLLTGNINILKLPHAGDVLSEKILMELLRIEPRLADYIYVFDYSSREIETMRRLVNLADAVVVWGGDAAVSAVRRMAKPDTRLIEWGHKISFAYVTEDGMDEESLQGLAWNICETNQLLCSSCQGIFLDTDSMRTVAAFCERFVEVLDRISRSVPFQPDIGTKAQITLKLYNAELEEQQVFRKGNSSLTVSSDPTPEASLMFRNCWVKPLPRKRILECVRPEKGRLQTVGLLCAERERNELANLFFRAGAVRVTSGKNMSAVFCGAAHDGEYSLRRYTKIVQMF